MKHSLLDKQSYIVEGFGVTWRWKVEGLVSSADSRLKEGMLGFSLLLVWVMLLQIAAASDLLAKCTAVSYDASSIVIDTCMSAIFSPTSFDVAGPVIIPNDATGCSAERIAPKAKPIAVVNRGMCTFETKSVMAERNGFLGLVIVNTDPSAFPVGASTETFRSSIPVVMIGNESLPGDFFEATNVRLRLSRLEPRKPGTLPPLHEQMIEHAPVLKTELLFALLVSFAVVLFRLWRHYSTDATAQPTTSKGATVFLAFVWVTSYGLLVLLFLASRVVTIRLLDTVESHKSAGLEYPLLAGYNHVETDELIFETLIRAVHHNHTDYSLQHKPILHILNLPRDNYDHPLFIHPPVFTYLASFLHYQGHVPLPLVPVFLQVGTLLCLPVIISSMFGGIYASRAEKEQERQATLLRVSLRAGWLFLLCPLAWFCSQKLWIDNALVFSCTMAWMVHVYLLKVCVPLSLPQALGRHVVSGLIFGGLSMNTKITALAMLPALCLWTLHCEYQWSRQELQNRATNHYKKTDDEQSVEDQPSPRWTWLRLILSWITFGFAALAGHSPWLLWYQKQTGRWMPSAWPSPAMLAQSSFVHAAVTGRPWYFYLEQSCTVLPFFLVAFLVVVVAAVVSACSRKRKFDGQVQVNHKHQQSDDVDVDVLWMALTILGTILLVFVVGLTLLGALGMGYQTRFILPLSPIVAIIVAVFTEELATLKLSSPLTAAWIDQMLSMIMVLTAIHGWYYGVQYPTRYADLHGGVFDVLASILRHPTDTEVQQSLLHIPSRAQATLKLLHTHGFLQQHD